MAKFREIPQFTKYPANGVFVSLNYLETKLTDEIKEYGLQLNPDFQRGHVWTDNQQIAFVEYILRGGQSGRDVFFNNPSWHVGEGGEYVCVDGLQRITALLRFVRNEIRAFGHFFNEYEDPRILSMRFGIYWHVNDLQTKKEVLTWYLEMNEGGTPHTKEELERVRGMLNEAKE
ncbi:MAG TPA: hypothetical protein DF296_13225 [Candidatus Margulisbacteria bacterium]|nr:hypothetical protein [Candidatus Margulisiibacteriota bacterium]